MAPPTRPAAQTSPWSVLLIEDDEDDAFLIRVLLDKAGQSTRFKTVQRLSDGLAAVVADPPDVVLLDLSLPDSQGVATLKAFVEGAPRLPVVVLTVLDDDDTALAAMREGAQDYLVKGATDAGLLVRTICYAVERKRVTEALLEQEALARAIIEQSADAICICDPETGYVLESNPAFDRLLGESPEDAEVAQAECFCASCAALAKAERHQLTIGGQPWRGEQAFSRRDGSTVTVESSIALIQHGGRQVLCGVIRDVTERRRAFEMQARLATAVEAAAEAILITDADGVIQYVNSAFEALTGYSAEEALGQNPRILKSGVHEEAFYRDMWETITRGEIWRGQITNKRRDGSLFTAAMTISPVPDEAGEILEYVGVERDITAELELQAELAQAETLHAIGQLAGGIAHDFNNIMLAVLGFADLVGMDLPADNPSQKDLEEIRKAATRGAGLARQLLAFSHQQAAEPERLDLGDLIKDFERFLRRMIGEDIDIILHLAPDLHTIRADPVQMQQVLMNLAVNAREAMPDGGTLRIETANAAAPPRPAGAEPEEPQAWIRWVVADTGVGMGPEILDRIFERQFTTKAAAGGSGLGLATVHEVVARAGGHIEVESEPGVGTTFAIYLPAIGEAAESDRAEQERQAPPTRGERVLLVEDEASLRQLLAKALASRGYDVMVAANGAEALALAADCAKPIDLLLTDAVMPQMSGTALIAQFAERFPSVRTLLMSGYPTEDLAQYGIDRAAVPFIAKPFGTQALLLKMREVLDSGG